MIKNRAKRWKEIKGRTFSPEQVEEMDRKIKIELKSINARDGKNKITGRVYKDGKFWLIEIPLLDAMTQGHTRKEALEMAQDLLETLVNDPTVKIKIATWHKTEYFEVSSDSIKFSVLILRRSKSRRGGKNSEGGRS